VIANPQPVLELCDRLPRPVHFNRGNAAVRHNKAYHELIERVQRDGASTPPVAQGHSASPHHRLLDHSFE
jgi:hypothetical protein